MKKKLHDYYQSINIFFPPYWEDSRELDYRWHVEQLQYFDKNLKNTFLTFKFKMLSSDKFSIEKWSVLNFWNKNVLKIIKNLLINPPIRPASQPTNPPMMHLNYLKYVF